MKYSTLVNKFIWLDSYYCHSCVYKDVLKEISLNIYDKVIDIGCGSSWLSRNIAKVVTKGEVVVLEISEDSIKKTKQVTEKDKSDNYNNLVFKVANVENIAYHDSYFNCAISLYSFSFWSNPVKYLKEIKRILITNGKLYIIDVYEDMSIGLIILMKLFNFFSPYKEYLYSAREYKLPPCLKKTVVPAENKKINKLGLL
jgi:ubiquinone/menaquinone biosynthesis C-methylase UbiE